MKLIDISTPKFPNTFTMVDDADFEWLNQWKWCIRSGKYAGRGVWDRGTVRTVYMHLEILKPPPGMNGDHRSGDKLDNRRENLRICTLTENNRNRAPTPGRTLPRGVDWRARKRRFRARIDVDKRQIYLGVFLTASEAGAAYVAAAKKYHGEFVRTTITPKEG